MKSREFGQLIKNISEILEWVGVVGVLSMMIITVVDVIGAKVFLSPLRGGMEMVGFGQVIAISCTITVGFVLGDILTLNFSFPGCQNRHRSIFTFCFFIRVCFLFYWPGRAVLIVYRLKRQEK